MKFERDEEAQLAIKSLNNTLWKGRKLEVRCFESKYSRNKDEQEEIDSESEVPINGPFGSKMHGSQGSKTIKPIQP